MKGLSSALFACSLLAPGLASAKTVVLTPLVGTDVKTVANVQSLMSSELDFMSDVESVVELPKAPATLNAACLTSTSCLGAIAKSNGGDQLVTGVLTVAAEEVKLDLVLFDVATNKTLRRKTWTLPNSPENIADGMGPLMRELMTGGAPAKAAAAAEQDFGTFEAEDDFAFEEEKPSSAKPVAKPPAAKPPAAKPTASKPIEEDDFEIELEDRVDPDEERRAAEEAAIEAAAVAAREKAAADAARKKAEEDARRKAEADAAKKKADEEARLAAAAAAKKKADDDARIAAAAAAKKKADDEARRVAAAEEARRAAAVAAAAEQEEEEEFDPSAISFGSTTGQIEQEEIEDAIQFAPSKPTSGSSSSASASRPATTTSTASRSRYDEEEPDPDLEAEEAELDLASLDEEEPASRSRTTSSSSSSSSRDRDEEEEEPAKSRTSSSSSSASLDRERPSGGSSDDEPATVQITVRGGYSKYYAFDFLTAGAEIGVNVVDKLYLLGGVDSYSVQRTIPPALQVEGRATEWNTIYPINAGLAYKFGDGAVHPYIGADVIFAPYYFAEGQTSWAVGGRGRTGVDLMVADVFGFNLNVAVGGWSGKDWGVIQRDIKTSGIVPQVNAGTVFAF